METVFEFVYFAILFVLSFMAGWHIADYFIAMRKK